MSRLMRMSCPAGVELLSLTLAFTLCLTDTDADFIVTKTSFVSKPDDDCMEAIRENLFIPHQGHSPYWAATGQIAPYDGEAQLLWYGRYDNCEALHDGKYCLADLLFSPGSHLQPLNYSQTGLSLRWGICAVDQCNNSILNQNMDVILQGVFGWQPVYIHQATVNCTVDVPHFSSGFIATMTIIAILLALCLVGTAVDLLYKHGISTHPKLVHCIDARGPHLVHPMAVNASSPDNNHELTSEEGHDDGASNADQSAPYQQVPPVQCLRKAFKTEPGSCTLFWQCFSAEQNVTGIFATANSKSRVGVLDGLRVLSMMWVILGHLYLGTFSTGMTENMSELLSWMNTFWWQFVGNAYYAIDTFLFLSGLLLSMQCLKAMDALGGRLPVVPLYVHRYIRLTLCMGLSMLIWIYVLPVMGSGPVWYSMTDQSNCDQYWWTNLLYIQNFYPTLTEDQCLGWFWYLAVDFQCFLVSPLVLYALYRGGRKGVIGVVVAILASCIVTASLIGYFKINVDLTGSVATNNVSDINDFENIIYTKSYCRVPPYLIGMLLGYKIHRDKGQPKRIPVVLLSVGWLACVATMFCLIWAFYLHLSDGSVLVSNCIYGALSHPLWALALAWIVYTSLHGYAGLFGRWLSWSGWQPLSRLTYSAYILHPLLMFMFNSSMKSPQHVSFYLMLIRYFGYVAMTYVFAITLMLLLELPVANLQKFCKISLPGRETSQTTRM